MRQERVVLSELTLEVLTGVTLKTLSNYMNHMALTRVIDIEDLRLCTSDGRSRWSAGEFRALASCLLTPLTPRYVA